MHVLAENIFNSIIEVVRSSADADKESMAILLEIIRDNYTSGADNQDLVEKLKQISHDEERFEIIWTKTSPFILEALKKLLQQALNRSLQVISDQYYVFNIWQIVFIRPPNYKIVTYMTYEAIRFSSIALSFLTVLRTTFRTSLWCIR